MAGFGLRIAKSVGMEGFTGNLSEFPISNADVTPMYIGDPVILSGGFCTAAVDGALPILGIFAGWEDTGPEAEYGGKTRPFRRYWGPSDGSLSNTPVAKVVMPSESLFWIKGLSGVNFQAATSIGASHPLNLAAGNSVFGESRVSLGAPAAGPVKVHRLVPMPGNGWGASEPILEVSINLQSATFADAS